VMTVRAFIATDCTAQLLGQEIMIGLVGLTWGVEIDCGIAAAGTILGERLTFLCARLTAAPFCPLTCAGVSACSRACARGS
jgi:hypothetical protein